MEDFRYEKENFHFPIAPMLPVYDTNKWCKTTKYFQRSNISSVYFLFVNSGYYFSSDFRLFYLIAINKQIALRLSFLIGNFKSTHFSLYELLWASIIHANEWISMSNQKALSERFVVHSFYLDKHINKSLDARIERTFECSVEMELVRVKYNMMLWGVRETRMEETLNDVKQIIIINLL